MKRLEGRHVVVTGGGRGIGPNDDGSGHRVAEDDGRRRADADRDAIWEKLLGRMSEPADVAGTVALLLSDDARGVTGRRSARTAARGWGRSG